MGLTQRVIDHLNSRGIQWQYTDLRSPVLPYPDLSALERLRHGQREVIDAVVNNDHGIIEAPTGFGKSFLISQISMIYPHAHIIVCSHSRSVVERNISGLTDFMPLSEIGHADGSHNRKGRVTVCTVQSLYKADLDKCRLLFYDECHGCATDARSAALANVRHARMFGFSATPFGRIDGADLVTESLFGRVIFKMDYVEGVEHHLVAPIKVFLVDYPCDLEIEAESKTARKRWGIWRNKERNKQIANIALSLPEEDEQVLIMVETLDHGLALHKMLRPHGFELVYASSSEERWKTLKSVYKLDAEVRPITDEKRLEITRRFESGDLKRAIATSTWDTGVDFKHLKVLIRADDNPGSIKTTQTSGRLSRLVEALGKTTGILVDFLDRFDDGFHRRALERVRVYRSQGWEVTRVEVPQAPLPKLPATEGS